MPFYKTQSQKTWLFTIIRNINNITYELQPPRTRKIHYVFHICLLKPYSTTKLIRIQELSPPLIVYQESEEYKVEEIVASKRDQNRILYLVHWKEYDVEDQTWEPARH